MHRRTAAATRSVRLVHGAVGLLSRVAGRLAVVTLLAAGVAVLTAGCRSEPLAKRRLATRCDSLWTTAERIADREAGSSRRLAKTTGLIPQRLRRDARALPRDLRWIGTYLERDLRGWQENQPRYWREAGRILRGQPETIERTAIVLFP
jgi:hypothetical protein